VLCLPHPADQQGGLIIPPAGYNESIILPAARKQSLRWMIAPGNWRSGDPYMTPGWRADVLLPPPVLMPSRRDVTEGPRRATGGVSLTPSAEHRLLSQAIIHSKPAGKQDTNVLLRKCKRFL
jgi:hypothetical protein